MDVISGIAYSGLAVTFVTLVTLILFWLIDWLIEGTILGPVRFIIYINDLPELCKQFVRVYLFADDAKLYAPWFFIDVGAL